MSVDKSGQRVRQMFGEIAGRYDLLNHVLSLNIDRYWRWRTVRLAPPPKDQPILDVCTGTGDLALAYHRATPGGMPIVGADFCRPMLVIGAEKAKKAKADDRLTFIEADAQELPFPDNSFGLVSVAFGLRNVSDTDRGLRELTRVCRAGGQVAVLEFSLPRWQPFRAIYSWYFRRVLPAIGQWMARNRQDAYNYLPASVLEFPDGEALARRMEGAGLAQVRFFPFTFGIATLYVGVKPAT